jgi:leader peptidase (prepilin peptidase) / N-methyltransferase
VNLELALGAAGVAAACGRPAAGAINALARGPADPVSQDASGRADPRAATASQAASSSAPAWLAGAWPISLLLAVLAFGIAVRLHPALVAVAGCWLVVCGVPLSVIDVRVRRLPDVLTGASLAGLAVLLIAAAAGTAAWPDLARAGAGGLVVGSMFGLLAIAQPGSAGLGDAKLGLSTGALAGWLGWGPLLASVFGSFLLAAAAGLWLVGTGRARLRGGSLPFGPFLLAGCLLVALVKLGN